MLGDHVTLDAGTGLVHTAPGHGEDDYIVSRKYDLPVISPVDSRGSLQMKHLVLKEYFYDKANPMITELLEEKGALLKLISLRIVIHMIGVPKNQLSTVQRHNGLLRSLNSVKIF